MNDDSKAIKQRRKRRLRRIYLLILLLLLAPYLSSRLMSGRRMVQVFEPELSSEVNRLLDESNVPATEISILIFNIAHGRGAVTSNLEAGGEAKRARISELAKFLVRVNADIVILNEVDFHSTWSGHQNQAESLANEANYPYRAEQRNLDFRFVYGSWQFGNAVLSRFPIRSYQLIDYPAHREWESILVGKKRGAVFSIGLPDSQMIEIAPIHLEHRGERLRVESVQEILRLIKTRRHTPILAGDFNSTPSGTPGAVAIENGGNAMDELIEANLYRPISIDNDAGFTFPSTDPKKTIDWIMVPHQFQLLEYRVLDSSLSDHLPVFAKIKLNRSSQLTAENSE